VRGFWCLLASSSLTRMVGCSRPSFAPVHLPSIGQALATVPFRELTRATHDTFSFFSPAPRFFRGALLPSVFFRTRAESGPVHFFT
jgi:hypothetical protein